MSQLRSSPSFEDASFIQFNTWDFGLVVEFDRLWLAVIRVPPEYKEMVEGICGDYSDDAGNDLTGQDGVDYSSDDQGHSSMAITWKVHDPRNPKLVSNATHY